MLTIKGKVNGALCYAKVVEDKAIEQIRRMCDYALTEGSQIRIMPDVHAGKGCTVGTTMTVIDKVCPNIVGVDIGCGMYTVKLADTTLDFEKLDAACHFIPSGLNVWDEVQEEFPFSNLRLYSQLKGLPRLERSLGTLGGGNHFIEVSKAKDGTYYLVIHSGSRNLGKQVAEGYQQLAIDLHKGRLDHVVQREALIAEYREAGRSDEIQSTLAEMQKAYEGSDLHVPEDLCWLTGEALEDYLHDIELCQAFAKRNRERMATIILEKTGMTALEAFHTIHNYISTEEMILRKGAISARAGEKVLIPINMRDGSVIAIGKGSEAWNFSAPHGAGRIMSRTQAKASLSLEEYTNTMEGVYTSSVNAGTLDEAPMAYKSWEDIMEVIGDTVEVIDVLKPVYNFKAAEDDFPWKKGRRKRGASR